MTEEEKKIPEYIDDDEVYNNLIKEFNEINDIITDKQTELELLDKKREAIIYKVKDHLKIDDNKNYEF